MAEKTFAERMIERIRSKQTCTIQTPRDESRKWNDAVQKCKRKDACKNAG